MPPGVTSSSPARGAEPRIPGLEQWPLKVCLAEFVLLFFSFFLIEFIQLHVCLSSQARPPPHEGDVSKPRKLSEPREPQTQEEAVWDLRGHRVLCAQDESRGRVPAKNAAQRG